MLILTDEKIPVWFTAHSDSNLTPRTHPHICQIVALWCNCRIRNLAFSNNKRKIAFIPQCGCSFNRFLSLIYTSRSFITLKFIKMAFAFSNTALLIRIIVTLTNPGQRCHLTTLSDPGLTAWIQILHLSAFPYCSNFSTIHLFPQWEAGGMWRCLRRESNWQLAGGDSNSCRRVEKKSAREREGKQL